MSVLSAMEAKDIVGKTSINHRRGSGIHALLKFENNSKKKPDDLFADMAFEMSNFDDFNHHQIV